MTKTKQKMKSKRKDGSRDTVFDGEEASEKERERELVLFPRQKNSGGAKRRRDFDRSMNLLSRRERQPAAREKEQSEASRDRTPQHPIFRTRT